mmetsp:Transcript_14337/g.45978  ORF Transcript_14337/g.45978 Transcript_14337/m.45978 type:complete len:312 (-) Transcript_14337:1251-2186(-)
MAFEPKTTSSCHFPSTLRATRTRPPPTGAKQTRICPPRHRYWSRPFWRMSSSAPLPRAPVRRRLSSTSTFGRTRLPSSGSTSCAPTMAAQALSLRPPRCAAPSTGEGTCRAPPSFRATTTRRRSPRCGACSRASSSSALRPASCTCLTRRGWSSSGACASWATFCCRRPGPDAACSSWFSSLPSLRTPSRSQPPRRTPTMSGGGRRPRRMPRRSRATRIWAATLACRTATTPPPTASTPRLASPSSSRSGALSPASRPTTVACSCCPRTATRCCTSRATPTTSAPSTPPPAHCASGWAALSRSRLATPAAP